MTKEELVAFFKQDQRKILITTIFKFGDVDSVLNERDNIILLVDEAHRTQEKEFNDKNAAMHYLMHFSLVLPERLSITEIRILFNLLELMRI